MADFNRIAPFYDVLKKVVFGNQIETASLHFLDEFRRKSNILIVGGGSGELLKNMDSNHQILFLELSDGMIHKAQKVQTKANVKFVVADLLTWKTSMKFDLVLTPFFLDCFNEGQLNMIVPKLKGFLKKDGYWVHTDFYPKNPLQNLLVSSMYLFFRLTSQLKTSRLENFSAIFRKHKLICLRKACFYHSMIESRVYQKIE